MSWQRILAYYLIAQLIALALYATGVLGQTSPGLFVPLGPGGTCLRDGGLCPLLDIRQGEIVVVLPPLVLPQGEGQGRQTLQTAPWVHERQDQPETQYVPRWEGLDQEQPGYSQSVPDEGE